MQFFNCPKRQHIILQLATEKFFPQTKQLCPIRWVNRHDAFEEIQPAVLDALNSIYLWEDVNISSSANQISTAIKELHFQVLLMILVKILGISFTLSTFIQKENRDLQSALEAASSVQHQIQIIRKNANEEFHKLFFNIDVLCQNLNIAKNIHRQNKHQLNRSNYNVATNDPEQFYRIKIFIPFLDNFLD